MDTQFLVEADPWGSLFFPAKGFFSYLIVGSLGFRGWKVEGGLQERCLAEGLRGPIPMEWAPYLRDPT